MNEYRQSLGALRTLLLVALGQGEIGERIKEAREEAGLTQPELANALGLKHPQSISNYERGIGEVPPRRLRQIAEVTRKPMTFFVQEPAETRALDGDVPSLAGMAAALIALERRVADQAQVVEAVVGAIEQNQTALDRIETSIVALLDAQEARPSRHKAGEHGNG